MLEIGDMEYIKFTAINVGRRTEYRLDQRAGDAGVHNNRTWHENTRTDRKLLVSVSGNEHCAWAVSVARSFQNLGHSGNIELGQSLLFLRCLVS